MYDILLRYLPLPLTVKGLAVQDEAGNYNIYTTTILTYKAAEVGMAVRSLTVLALGVGPKKKA